MTEPTAIPAERLPPRDPAKPPLGELLCKLREEKGLSHAAVGQALHLTAHYIRALENDDYAKLPGLTFVKGYLRVYARFVGADEVMIIARFDDHIAGLLDAGKQTERVQRSRRRQDQALRWAIGAGFVVVAGLVAGWWFMSGQQASQTSTPVAQTTTAAARTNSAVATPAATRTTAPTGADATSNSTAAPATVVATETGTVEQTAVVDAGTTTEPPADDLAATTPAGQPPATPVAAETAADDGALTVTPEANGARRVSLLSVGEDELRVIFNGNSWIEVDNGRGIRLYNDMLRAGDTLTIRGEAPFRVLLGDATQVDVSLNAVAIDISADIRDDSTARLILRGIAGAEASDEAPL